MNFTELKEFLDEKVVLYNNKNFIDSDPVQIPHLYSQKEDIEIAGFLAATIAWGNRKMIINNSHKLMQIMGNSPYDFILNHQKHHLESLDHFVHRTFNGLDLVGFIKGLQHIYENHGGLETVFARNRTETIGRIGLLRGRRHCDAAAAEQRKGNRAFHGRASVTRIGTWSDPVAGSRRADTSPQSGPA